MNKDFTISIYKKIISIFQSNSFSFQTFSEYLDIPIKQSIILRHDVDRKPNFSLEFAQFQQKRNIRSTYFFRIVPESFKPEIISNIASLDHEIGYHYEDVDLAYRLRKIKGERLKIKVEDLLDDAIESFEKNLKELRKYYPVKTICMHGSPLSPFDNKALWTKHDYRDFGIIGEPYFDIDFNEVAYYTDTGRRWDGQDVSVRDKVDKEGMGEEENGSKGEEEKGREGERENSPHHPLTSPPHLITPSSHHNPFPSFHSTQDIIRAIISGTFPSKAMLTFHPQRWTNYPLLWTKELVMQNAKNVVKKYFFVK